MGRQVRFIALSSDLKLLEEHIHRTGGCLLAYFPNGTEPRLVETFQPPTYSDHQIWATLRSEIHNVRTRHVEQLAHYLIDSMVSPVVQISRGPDLETPSEGRVYFQTRYVVDLQWANFDEEFVARADSLLKWMRRTFHYDRTNELHEGPGAAAWRLSH